jgi:hypothetical protein
MQPLCTTGRQSPSLWGFACMLGPIKHKPRKGVRLASGMSTKNSLALMVQHTEL